MKTLNNTNIIQPDQNGYFGKYGGQYVNQTLIEELNTIEKSFREMKQDNEFKREFYDLLKHYVGRPSPIYFASKLSNKYGAEIYLKREDLNHTGAHKINHCIGEALLAKKMGKTKLIADTGAGQHGVAVATVAALFGLTCDIYMGETDIKKESINVGRMKLLGANVIPVSTGTKTLKEAVDMAFNTYEKEHATAFYVMGSVVGPHPFPEIVEYFQSIIGEEANVQFKEITNMMPDYVVACIGGGSNAIGIFDGFLNENNVKLIGVEPLGRGTLIGENAATITYGREGILHGFRSLLLQNNNGSVANAYSVASGLDYPGIGPKHCYLKDMGFVTYDTIGDKEAIEAFYELAKLEGIIPALESAHAIAYAIKLAQSNPNKRILVNLSGRGDKDIDFIFENYPN